MTRKSPNNHYDLPPLELRCMRALWAARKATVQEIRDRLMPDRPLAYTTVMTVMDRLARKGVVERDKKGRAHIYSPAVSEEIIRERALHQLLANFFEGAHEGLRQYLERKKSAIAGAGEPARDRVRRPSVRHPREKAQVASMDASLL